MNAAPARCCTPSSQPEGGSSLCLRRLLPLQGLLLLLPPPDATFSRHGAAAAGVSERDGQSYSRPHGWMCLAL